MNIKRFKVPVPQRKNKIRKVAKSKKSFLKLIGVLKSKKFSWKSLIVFGAFWVMLAGGVAAMVLSSGSLDNRSLAKFVDQGGSSGIGGGQTGIDGGSGTGDSGDSGGGSNVVYSKCWDANSRCTLMYLPGDECGWSGRYPSHDACMGSLKRVGIGYSQVCTVIQGCKCPDGKEIPEAQRCAAAPVGGVGGAVACCVNPGPTQYSENTKSIAECTAAGGRASACYRTNCYDVNSGCGLTTIYDSNSCAAANGLYSTYDSCQAQIKANEEVVCWRYNGSLCTSDTYPVDSCDTAGEGLYTTAGECTQANSTRVTAGKTCFRYDRENLTCVLAEGNYQSCFSEGLYNSLEECARDQYSRYCFTFNPELNACESEVVSFYKQPWATCFDKEGYYERDVECMRESGLDNCFVYNPELDSCEELYKPGGLVGYSEQDCAESADVSFYGSDGNVKCEEYKEYRTECYELEDGACRQISIDFSSGGRTNLLSQEQCFGVNGHRRFSGENAAALCQDAADNDNLVYCFDGNNCVQKNMSLCRNDGVVVNFGKYEQQCRIHAGELVYCPNGSTNTCDLVNRGSCRHGFADEGQCRISGLGWRFCTTNQCKLTPRNGCVDGQEYLNLDSCTRNLVLNPSPRPTQTSTTIPNLILNIKNRDWTDIPSFFGQRNKDRDNTDNERLGDQENGGLELQSQGLRADQESEQQNQSSEEDEQEETGGFGRWFGRIRNFFRWRR